MSEAEIIDAETEEIEEVRQLPAVRMSEAVVARGEITVDELLAQASKIQDVMSKAMKKGVHYGDIPGINKPTLLKPGAELLNVLLRLSPSYKSEKIFQEGGHLTVISNCTLTHIPTGLVIAEGEGLCSTREAKYAYRQGGRTCPACGMVGSIKRSKYPPREGDYPGAQKSDAPGWYCHSKVGGCGANFAANDDVILAQPDIARIDNPDLPDTWNTVLKMSDKRALVAAVLNGTGASDVFTQDVEDQGKTAADTHEIEAEEEEQLNDDDVDPGKNLLSNAMKGNDAKALYATMQSLNDSFDWGFIIAVTLHTQYGVESREKLAQADRNQWWMRLRNAVAKAEAEAADLGGEKASSPEQITSAFVWAFPKWDGTTDEPAEAAPEDDEPSDAALTPDEQKRMEEAGTPDVEFGASS